MLLCTIKFGGANLSERWLKYLHTSVFACVCLSGGCTPNHIVSLHDCLNVRDCHA